MFDAFTTCWTGRFRGARLDVADRFPDRAGRRCARPMAPGPGLRLATMRARQDPCAHRARTWIRRHRRGVRWSAGRRHGRAIENRYPEADYRRLLHRIRDRIAGRSPGSTLSARAALFEPVAARLMDAARRDRGDRSRPARALARPVREALDDLRGARRQRRRVAAITRAGRRGRSIRMASRARRRVVFGAASVELPSAHEVTVEVTVSN